MVTLQLLLRASDQRRFIRTRRFPINDHRNSNDEVGAGKITLQRRYRTCPFPTAIAYVRVIHARGFLPMVPLCYLTSIQ